MAAQELEVGVAGHISCLLAHANVDRCSNSHSSLRCLSFALASSIAAITAVVVLSVLGALTVVVHVPHELSPYGVASDL
jgi:hypothetical protein